MRRGVYIIAVRYVVQYNELFSVVSYDIHIVFYNVLAPSSVAEQYYYETLRRGLHSGWNLIALQFNDLHIQRFVFCY